MKAFANPPPIVNKVFEVCLRYLRSRSLLESDHPKRDLGDWKSQQMSFQNPGKFLELLITKFLPTGYQTGDEKIYELMNELELEKAQAVSIVSGAILRTL